MLKKFVLSIGVVGLLAGAFSCNSDSNSEIYTGSILDNSTQVTAFSLTRDDSVLVSLDSVFFSIDLKNATIFNADSLPFGTRIDKLVPKISYTAASKAEITYPRPGMADSVVDYLNHSTDSIDFSHGNVKFRIVSGNGESERTYSIKVNVHKMKPDSLYWSDMAYAKLPTNLSAPTAQRTVRLAGKAYCLTASGKSYCIASTATPADNNSWEKATVNFGFTPKVNSFAATSDALFILGTDGKLYKSADGSSWTATGEIWYSIIGGYGTDLMGVKTDGTKYYHATYPATAETEVKEGFPVSDISQPITFDTQWGNKPQLYILGGLDSQGKTVAHTWGYDGKVWARISSTPLPFGVAGITMFPYHSYLTNTDNWSVTGYEVLIALGGKKADGAINRKTYISYNMGLVWRECSELMQLPAEFPETVDAQALVFSSTLHARSNTAAGWTSVAGRKLPPYYMIAPASPASRAVKPIESWDCPYIYLFGGTDLTDTLNDSVWRGVLNRLTFKPLQ